MKHSRIVIESISPQVNSNAFPVKRSVGEEVIVRARAYAEGNDCISVCLRSRSPGEQKWRETAMRHTGNDWWEGVFLTETVGTYMFTVSAWVNRFMTWQRNMHKKYQAGQDMYTDFINGRDLIEKLIAVTSAEEQKKLSALSAAMTANLSIDKLAALIFDAELMQSMNKTALPDDVVRYEHDIAVVAEREKTRFSTWYELFPRSCGADMKNKGNSKLLECARLLPEIAQMGFDVLYLPPIHPIGTKNRKGKNNAIVSTPGDPGSPWAIGSLKGGHTAMHPELGTLQDFKQLVKKAEKLGLEVALDLAFQCSPDHPYVREHPEWFTWRSDKSIQYAENPPKKYEDIVPFNFESETMKMLWDELRRVILFWITHGIRIFRVDNPHTKPFVFWEWFIKEIHTEYPDVIFLSEAFTRPAVMYRLAKVGFAQSYTYFTWRNTKQEITEYIQELTGTDIADYFRPNFWPNTPDILPEILQYGGKPAFMSRLILAATLSSNYGIYGPAFELCVNEALPGTEEYCDSEKYELKNWDRNKPGNIKALITHVNAIRKENPALQHTRNIQFFDISNNQLIAYGKISPDKENIIITIVNLDPFHTQSGWLRLPLVELGIEAARPYLAYDLLSNDKYLWQGETNYIELNPQLMPAHILRIHSRIKREQDFDYYLPVR